MPHRCMTTLFLVCNEDIDHIIGYVDSKDLLNRVLANQSLALNSGVQIRNTLIVPDTLTLSEAWKVLKPQVKTSR